MSSRKEEERNEKIIRGLMKLPPNRRCINCNSLGPQYVCTNFWCFICMTCSGIHREFTHRVKSVSMAKFTSQEVEALQKGGNQRAREIFLKDWDSQRQRLPDSSNVDKIRQFIKSVYVDRKYAGGKTSDKPPRDMQNHRNHEDETRRASSYHSYSQSPPYDYQYEDRRYGRHTPALTRKPGSDRGIYEGKISSFSSPSHLSDQIYDDGFANEGSSSRVSDYSVSSTGDPFRSGAQSPSFQKDIGFSSPSSQTSRDILKDDVQNQTVNAFSEANGKRDANGVPRQQRTASSSSFGSFDGKSMSVKSPSSVSLMDVASVPQQSAEAHNNNLSACSILPQSSMSENFGGLDLFDASFTSKTFTSSASAVDLFQLPEAPKSQSIDLFQPFSNPPAATLNVHPVSQTTPSSSLDLFSEIPQQQSAATLDKKSRDLVIPKNEGWATFDVPQHMAFNVGIETSNSEIIAPPDGNSLGKFDPLLPLNMSTQWPSFQDSNAHGPSSVSNPWPEGASNGQASFGAGSTLAWNAFADSNARIPHGGNQQNSEHVAVHQPSSTANQHLGLRVSEDSNNGVIQKSVSDTGPMFPSLPSLISGPSSAPFALPPTEGAVSQTYVTDQKSTNPFDLPFDSDLESSDMFLNMTSLQATLPNAQLPPSSFLGGVTHPWFSQNQATSYIPSAPQGALGFMAGQSPSTQIPNVPTQGPVASVGGNPFE